jgi:glycosyl transferase family 25
MAVPLLWMVPNPCPAFMRIFFLNLDRASERREKMERQFAALGLDAVRFQATDGRRLTDADRALVDNNARRRISPYPLSDNEIGCWLTHRRALQGVADGKDMMAAIVEDDAELSPDFSRALDAIERQRPDFDFLFLHRKFKKGEIFIPHISLLQDLHMGRVGPAHMGAIGYVVSRKGAQGFISRARRAAHAIDKEMHRYWANGLDIHGLDRPLVVHADGGHSFIEETREQNRPEVRPCYPDAGSFYWRMRRGFTRFSDGIGKRRAWAAYRHEGKMHR